MSQDRFRYIAESSDDEELIVIGPKRGSETPTDRRSDAEPEGCSDSSVVGSCVVDSSEREGSPCKGDFLPNAVAADSPLDPFVDPGKSSFFGTGGGGGAQGQVPSPEDSDSEIKVPFLTMQRVILVVMALLVAGFLVYFLCGCSSSKGQDQDVSHATNKTILQYDLSSDGSSAVSSKAYDVTGDAEPDKVTLKPELAKGSSGSALKGLVLKVNKKKAMSLSVVDMPALSKVKSVSLKLMTLTDGAEYLFLGCEGDDGAILSGVYGYSKGKMKPLVTSYSDDESVWNPVSGMHDARLYAQANEDRIAVTVDFDCYATGSSEVTFDFVQKGRLLALSGAQTENFGFKASGSGAYDKPSVTACRSFAVYEDESLGAYSFTVSSGDTCTLESLSVSDGKLKFMLRDGEKSGWFASPTYGYRTYFEETNESWQKSSH